MNNLQGKVIIEDEYFTNLNININDSVLTIANRLTGLSLNQALNIVSKDNLNYLTTVLIDLRTKGDLKKIYKANL